MNVTQNLPLTRRAAFAAGAAALGTAMTHPATAAEENLPWIDAHSHIWPPEVDKFPLAPGKTKQRDDSFADAHLLHVDGLGNHLWIACVLIATWHSPQV